MREVKGREVASEARTCSLSAIYCAVTGGVPFGAFLLMYCIDYIRNAFFPNTKPPRHPNEESTYVIGQCEAAFERAEPQLQSTTRLELRALIPPRLPCLPVLAEQALQLVSLFNLQPPSSQHRERHLR